ncbi:uncharacterized protein LY89DRAFT_668128 [Mollisia scopiformis]|uniref:Zn(2)-C6 fungal-type domain-containing protein n=1 Tax=Mollisia scopiformis TaxID=149040 RepID=A0A194XCL8_MOLSC|nr:uncharacterized protein LY89DRAFT_668128 [Mollisia scopiformis]KUJ17915.1 hypothetical protein LY89DRAFT_668128 [Mollisia scopiformis]
MRNRPRRKQFSSCDACRQSRVACDATKRGHQPNQTTWNGACSRCLSRNRKCTFKVQKSSLVSMFLLANHYGTYKWIGKSTSRLGKDESVIPVSVIGDLSDGAPLELGNEASNGRTENHVYETSPSEIVASHEAQLPIPTIESGDTLLAQWSKQIYHHIFSSIFGHCLGRNGCPFVNNPPSDIFLAPTKLFKDLDAYIDKQQAPREQDAQIEQFLDRAIQAFAARWLPVTTPKTPHLQEVIKKNWRALRRDMLRVINHPSYCSVLTLYLFGQTPVPAGVTSEEESDGISSAVCIQTALLHIQQLRHSCQFLNLPPAFVELESRAYWAGVMWDTTNSLLLNIRSSLTSGLKGACLEPAWKLARGFLASFHSKTEIWQKKSFEASEEEAQQVISAANVCSVYTWKTIASVKEALREGVEESDLMFSWDAFLDALDVFKSTIRPLMSTCQKRLHFLGQVERLKWYHVVLEYYLGILLLVETIEGAGRQDLLSKIVETRTGAELESFNVLKFGLESRYTITEHSTGTELVGKQISVSFIAIDPYPTHVVALVQLMTKAIKRRYQQGDIKQEVHSYLSSTLLKVLEELPPNSCVV